MKYRKIWTCDQMNGWTMDESMNWLRPNIKQYLNYEIIM